MATLAYHRSGSGEPLVLVHGIGSRWQIWHPVLARLAKQRDVLAVDLPGFGASPPDDTVPTVEGLADRLQAWFTELGIERPHVAGSSMGGGIALELARRRAVRSATAFSPIGFWTPRERMWCQGVLRAARSLLRRARPHLPVLLRFAPVRAALLGIVFAKPWRMSVPDALVAIDGMIDAANFDPALEAFTGHRFADPDALRGLTVAVVWGKCDAVLPSRQGARARRLLPWARHVSLERCGHVPFLDAPALCAQVILDASRET